MTNPSPNTTEDITRDAMNFLYGKSLDGHPLFKVDLKKALESELGPEEAADILKRYSEFKYPTYDVHSDVYLIIEPSKDDPENFEAYMTTYPSDEQFEKLKELNPELRKFPNVTVYMEEIEKKFFLPAYDLNTYITSDEREGKYEKRSLFVPFSQREQIKDEIKTPLAHMLDQLIMDRLSSNK